MRSPHERLRAPLRLALLVLVVEAAGDRVMRVVRLADEVGDRELDLLRLGAEPARRREPARAAVPRKARMFAVCDDDDVADLDERRRERQRAGRSPSRNRTIAATPPRRSEARDVDVARRPRPRAPGGRTRRGPGCRASSRARCVWSIASPVTLRGTFRPTQIYCAGASLPSTLRARCDGPPSTWGPAPPTRSGRCPTWRIPLRQRRNHRAQC